jgi:hypothetical protein
MLRASVAAAAIPIRDLRSMERSSAFVAASLSCLLLNGDNEKVSRLKIVNKFYEPLFISDCAEHGKPISNSTMLFA